MSLLVFRKYISAQIKKLTNKDDKKMNGECELSLDATVGWWEEADSEVIDGLQGGEVKVMLWLC